MGKIRTLEILMVEIIIYLFIWMLNEYLATMLSLIFGTICLLILLISLVVEFIERSKVPKWYFGFMAMSILAPILAAAIYLGITGNIDWLREI